MSAPSAMELTNTVLADADDVVRYHLTDRERLHQAILLAARVEAVLALKPMQSDGSFAAGSAWMLAEVFRLLNGEEP